MNYSEMLINSFKKKSMESYFLRIGVMNEVYFVNLIFNHRP